MAELTAGKRIPVLAAFSLVSTLPEMHSPMWWLHGATGTEAKLARALNVALSSVATFAVAIAEVAGFGIKVIAVTPGSMARSDRKIEDYDSLINPIW